MDRTSKDQLDRMFNPRGLAFFGGIASPGAFGNLIALSQIHYGYKGNLYPISPKGGEIAGHKIYKSLEDLPDKFSLDELLDKLILVQKIEIGLEQSDSG